MSVDPKGIEAAIESYRLGLMVVGSNVRTRLTDAIEAYLAALQPSVTESKAAPLELSEIVEGSDEQDH